jgi:hypothetical protein
MASRSLGTLTLDLVAKIGGFEAGMGRAEREAARRSKAISKAINDAAALGIKAFAGLSAAGVAAFAVINRQAENIANFQGLSEKIGDTAQAVSSLKLASDVSGVSLDTVAAASVRLTASLSKTDDEAKGVGAAIKALGLNFDEFKAKSPVDQIEAVSQALNKFADGSEKTAVAVALFGKAGADLIPFLNDLSNGSERQIKLTNEQIAQADQYVKATARLKSEFETFLQIQSAQAIPTLTEVASLFAEIAKNEQTLAVVTEVVKAAMKAAIVVFQTVAVVGSDVGFVFLSVGREIGAWAAQLNAIARGDLKGFRAISEAVKADADRARAELDAFQRRVMQLGQPVYMDDEVRRLQNRSNAGNAPASRPRLNISGLTSGGGAGGGRSRASEEQRAAEQAAKQAESYLDNLKRQLEATEKLSVAETVLRDIQTGRLTVANDAIKESVLDTARQIDAAREAEQILKSRRQLVIDEFEAVEKANEAYQSLIESLLDATPTAQLEKQRQTMLALAEAYEKGQISAEQFGEAANTYLGNLPKAIEETQDVMKELGATFASAFEDAIVGGKGLSDVLKGLEQDIIRIITRKLVTEPLANAIGGLFSGGGGGWLSLIGGLFGGTPAFDVGTNYVPRDMLAMVHKGKKIIPAALNKGGGEAMIVNNNFTLPPSVDRRTQEQIAAMTGSAVNRAVRRHT